MKNIRLTLLMLSVTRIVCAQALPIVPDHIDFSAYAPTRIDQFKGTCYAYATTYTALTVKFNVLTDAQTAGEINDNAFSAAFTASVVRRQKFFLARIFSFWSCSSGGNIQKAAKVIQQKGAILNNSENGCCFVPGQKQFADAIPFKIKDFKIILAIKDARDQVTLTNKFKSYLCQRIPIVCAIHQTKLFRDNDKIDFTLPVGGDPGINNTSYQKSNHAICIVGYDDHRNGGSYLVKNNYSGFGVTGRAWIKYDDFYSYLSYALILGDFLTPPAG